MRGLNRKKQAIVKQNLRKYRFQIQKKTLSAA